ncbi:26S proteasome non-ATPase regulatory subunit 6 [Thraustotheca clavata]|uniref:26S proteasome non-ATPase regulatory subunit 6 n=1 Tax=Thraustotheca clavata TaxID=74557 RepID=A0A1V9YXX1_9STRA|nr:26S proteasome non-ATPase regulatory subunit 6 [Thraustotheca clavata]
MGVNDEKKGSHVSEDLELDISTLPTMEISHLHYLLHASSSPHAAMDATTIETTKSQLLQQIQEYNMAPYYQQLCNEFQWTLDTELLAKMKKANEQELEALDAQLEDATKNLGDIEVLEAHLARARLYSKIGDKTNVLEAFKTALTKPTSINQKIIIELHIIRIGLFFSDLELVETHIKKATTLIDEGGDWDRRNRLKVYEGCYLLMARDFKKASKLFQESVATFTSTELMTYPTMIFYAVITCVLSMDRVELKKKIVDSSEVLAVILDTPYLSDFLNGLYDCNYKQFFTAMVQLHPHIHRDKYLANHSRFIYRELRILAYSQFLQSYRSVTMQSMAQSFGIGVAFLDSELSRFIAAGRLNAKIDKVAGVIETNRPDAKNAQYQETIKKGDTLLNRIQKLARVINV